MWFTQVNSQSQQGLPLVGPKPRVSHFTLSLLSIASCSCDTGRKHGLTTPFLLSRNGKRKSLVVITVLACDPGKGTYLERQVFFTFKMGTVVFAFLQYFRLNEIMHHFGWHLLWALNFFLPPPPFFSFCPKKIGLICAGTLQALLMGILSSSCSAKLWEVCT